MYKKTEQFLVKILRGWSITPNALTYVRIFAAPWLGLLALKTIADKSVAILVFTIVVYAFVVATDFLDGVLARHISSSGDKHDHSFGAMLDRLSDKLLIIFMLVPFGFNIFTMIIILGESILAFQAIHSDNHKKSATRAGKIKMVFQFLLVPVLLASRATSMIPDILLFAFLMVVIFLTYRSIYSHYFQDE